MQWATGPCVAVTSYVDQPIPEDQTFLNIYAPGVVQHHLSLGATWRVSKTGELSMSLHPCLQGDRQRLQLDSAGR